MNKIYILFLCLCYAVSAIMANTYKNDKEVTSPTDANIFGHVVDKATGEHLPGITIILKGTTIGSVTDDSGHYMLKNLPEGEFTIEVSFVGFKTVTKKVTTGKGKTQELNFELEEDLISLEGVGRLCQPQRDETPSGAYPGEGTQPDRVRKDQLHDISTRAGFPTGRPGRKRLPELWLLASPHQRYGRKIYTDID